MKTKNARLIALSGSLLLCTTLIFTACKKDEVIVETTTPTVGAPLEEPDLTHLPFGG